MAPEKRLQDAVATELRDHAVPWWSVAPTARTFGRADGDPVGPRSPGDCPPGAATDLPLHGALRPLSEAAGQARHAIAVLTVAMDWRPRPSWPRQLEILAKALVFLGAHVRMAGRLWRQRQHELILVREFLTALVVAVWPVIWPLRRRVYFLVNHNLQEAHRRGLERCILRLLHRTGFRFACFETTAGFAELGIIPDAERFLVLPHPLAPSSADHSYRPLARVPVVGVVGEVRAEKGSTEILETLLALRDRGLAMHLVLGCPDPEAHANWRARGVEVADTRRHQAYLAALGRCDVIVLNYRAERYRYRPSGVAADALARGAAVVCPDFPVMRQQLTVPTRVGTVFADAAQLGDAVREALALRPQLARALSAHRRARSAPAIAQVLDRFVERRNGASKEHSGARVVAIGGRQPAPPPRERGRRAGSA